MHHHHNFVCPCWSEKIVCSCSGLFHTRSELLSRELSRQYVDNLLLAFQLLICGILGYRSQQLVDGWWKERCHFPLCNTVMLVSLPREPTTKRISLFYSLTIFLTLILPYSFQRCLLPGSQAVKALARGNIIWKIVDGQARIYLLFCMSVI